MPANAAINSMNTAIALNAQIAAQQAADESHLARCTVEMQYYAPRTATVAQMQSYAACVDYVHPAHHDADLIGMKIIVGVLLAGTIIGAIAGAFDRYDKVLAVPGLAFLGFILAAVGLLVAAGGIFIFS